MNRRQPSPCPSPLRRERGRNALRLIDANLNRVKEGLRVCEDIARFLYDDQNLTASFKRLRHAVSKELLRFPAPYRELVRYRNSSRDVGRGSTIFLKRKLDWEDLFVSNIKRAEEGLRVLEEASKVLSWQSARKFQKLRFELYELEKKALKKF